MPTQLGNEELNTLKQKSPYSLPDNPSDKGLSAKQIKTKFYEGLVVLFNWLKRSIDENNTEFQSISQSFNTIFSYFTDGKAKKSIADQLGNIIDETYLPFSGGTLTGDLSLVEAAKLIFGGNVSFEIDNGHNLIIKVNGGSGNVSINASVILPNSDGTTDIGSSSKRIKNVHVSGVLSDGTNSITVNKIVSIDTVQTITALKQFDVIPQTKVGRTYTSPRQLTDKQYVDETVDEAYQELDEKIDEVAGEHETINTRLENIEDKIPNQASSSNKLVDRDTMNSTMQNMAMFFRGNFETKADLLDVDWQTTDPDEENYVTNNDYAQVNDDESHNHECWRYKFFKQGNISMWRAEARVNERPFTSDQNKAINSGATTEKIAQIETNRQAIVTLGANKLDATTAAQLYQKKNKRYSYTITPENWTFNPSTNLYEVNVDLEDEFTDNDEATHYGMTTLDRNLMRTYRIDVICDNQGIVHISAMIEPVDTISIGTRVVIGD